MKTVFAVSKEKQFVRSCSLFVLIDFILDETPF